MQTDHAFADVLIPAGESIPRRLKTAWGRRSCGVLIARQSLAMVALLVKRRAVHYFLVLQTTYPRHVFKTTATAHNHYTDSHNQRNQDLNSLVATAC